MAVVESFDPFYEPAVKRANIGRHVVNGAIALFEVDIRQRAAMDRVFREVGPGVVVSPCGVAGALVRKQTGMASPRVPHGT